MFLLVTGASGVGKSTVRRLVAARFATVMEAAELAELGRTPEWTLKWRHEAAEWAVQRALELQREGRHFLLAGDPVAPGEVIATPSADRLEGLAVCLLDASEAAQRQRLTSRGDDPSLLVHHVAFQTWMRAHVADPSHRPHVIMQGAWDAMRWERWLVDGRIAPRWTSHVIDTSDRSPEEVAEQVDAWIRRTLALGDVAASA